MINVGLCVGKFILYSFWKAILYWLFLLIHF